MTMMRGILAGILALTLHLPGFGQYALTLGDTTLTAGSASVTVLLDTDVELDGYVISVAYDATLVVVSDLGVAGTVAGGLDPEGVFPEILPGGGLLLGVFFDIEAPFDGPVLAPGAAISAASFDVAPVALVDRTTGVTLSFVDGVFGSPAANNQLVTTGGGVVDAGTGLILTDGSVTLEPGELSLSLVGSVFAPGLPAEAEVRLDNTIGEIQSYSLNVQHIPGELEFAGIDVEGTLSSSADYVDASSSSDGSVDIVAIADLEPPVNPGLPAGIDQLLVRVLYTCSAPPILPSADLETPLEFGPTTLTIGGSELSPFSSGGAMICPAIEPPNTTFWIGPAEGPATGTPIASPGGSVELGFYYADPDNEIQGLQLAVGFDCGVVLESEFLLAGSILESVTAEFIAFNTESDPDDGDGCEYVCGILLDSNPPFEGQTLPLTSEPILLGRVTAVLNPEALPGSSYGVQFVDGVDGAGSTPIVNTVVIDFGSVPVLERFGTAVVAQSSPNFRRGDCNDDGQVDLADCIAILDQAFEGSEISCFAACDATADGALDLQDFLALANYLFLGGPPVPAPLDVCGPSPEEDCESFSSCL